MMAESRNDEDPKSELRNMIQQVFQFLHQQSHLSRMMIPLALELESFQIINDIMKKKMEDYLGRLMLLFKEMGYEDPEMEAWTLGVLFDGVSLDYAVIGKELPIERIGKYLYKKYEL